MIEATCEHPYEVVGSFLSHDVRGSEPVCDYFLEKAMAVANGAEPIETFGDAHDVTICADHVALMHRYIPDDFPAMSVKLESFIEVLTFWKDIIKKWDRAGRSKDFTASAEFDFPAVDIGRRNGDRFDIEKS
jgi:hypothetical protein